MLSKTVNGKTIEFEYTNAEWQDQLTKVNGKSLTYDANGNLQSYDGAEYTWSHGKRLSSITKGDTTYEYQYDLNGIRSYKTVNGVKTKFDTLNGKIFAQSDTNNKILFQYNGDTPVGFELNETQYFYLTNLSGDVVGITDADGNLIAEYSYDEWGKLLGIETAEDGNAEQLAIAEANPLRYRGYYYDNETGMYYLQSRYYNPELCRFISADSFSFVNNRKELNVNAYTYCINDPVNYIDPLGTKKREIGEVTDVGIAVAKIFGALMVISDAFMIDEDFGYYIAGVLANNIDLLFRKTGTWYKDLISGFKEFKNTYVYKNIKSYDKDIFKKFYDASVNTGKSYYKNEEGNIIIAYYRSYLDKFINEFFEKLYNKNVEVYTESWYNITTIVSMGTDVKSIVLYIQRIYNNYTSGITAKFTEIKNIKLSPVPEFAYSAEITMFILILLGILVGGITKGGGAIYV